MNNQSARWLVPILLSLGGLVSAQEQSTPTAAVSRIEGVKEDAVETVKHVERGNAARSGAQVVNKINGVETVNGVKADGRAVVPPTGTVVPPPPPPPTAGAPPPTSPTSPPPPPIVSAGGTAVPAAGGAVGSTANIRAIKGVSGIDSAKLQNLEKALQLKQDGGGTPTGKGKAAAAALGGSGPGLKPAPKADGREDFQEFQKLQNNGS